MNQLKEDLIWIALGIPGMVLIGFVLHSLVHFETGVLVITSMILGRKRSAACVHTAYRTPVFATNVIDRRTPRFNICASDAERNMPLKPDMAIHVAIGRDGRERYRHLRRAWRR